MQKKITCSWVKEKGGREKTQAFFVLYMQIYPLGRSCVIISVEIEKKGKWPYPLPLLYIFPEKINFPLGKIPSIESRL